MKCGSSPVCPARDRTTFSPSAKGMAKATMESQDAATRSDLTRARHGGGARFNRGGSGMPDEPTNPGGEAIALLDPEVRSGTESLPAERCLQIYQIIVRT